MGSAQGREKVNAILAGAAPRRPPLAPARPHPRAWELCPDRAKKQGQRKKPHTHPPVECKCEGNSPGEIDVLTSLDGAVKLRETVGDDVDLKDGVVVEHHVVKLALGRGHGGW